MAQKDYQTKPRREWIREQSQGKGETPDPEPIHIPGKSDAPLTLRDEMRRYIREQLSIAAQNNDAGTFEEEDDFTEENEDLDLLSPYTVVELTPETNQLDNDLEGEQYEAESVQTTHNPEESDYGQSPGAGVSDPERPGSNPPEARSGSGGSGTETGSK